MTNEMWKEMSQSINYEGPLYAPHPQIYKPRVNDYVKYSNPSGNHLQGWIYYIDPTNLYLTLEIMVREKSEQSYKDCNLHRNERCLVCVFPEDWNRLEYVKSR